MLACPVLAFAIILFGLSGFLIYGGIKTYNDYNKVLGYVFVIIGILLFLALMSPIAIVVITVVGS